MQTAHVVVPIVPGVFRQNTPGSFSTAVIAAQIRPFSAVCKLGRGLTFFDTFQVYAGFESSLTPASPNAVPIGIVRGNDGDINFDHVNLSGYPIFIIQRLTGNAAGIFFASGPAPQHGPAPANAVLLPAVGAFSALLDVRYFNDPILVGLDSSATSNDVFNVYGTDDNVVVNTSGATFLGQIQGGGDLTGTTLLTKNYDFILCERISGLAGTALLAYGEVDAGHDGFIVVPSQVGGVITPTLPLTAQELVDQNFVILVDQTGALGSPPTLAAPSSPLLPMMRIVKNIGTAALADFYGMNIQPPTAPANLQFSTAIAMWDPLNATWTLAGNANS